MELNEANDMNVPVGISIYQDDDTKKWTLSADNYMPRKSMVSEGEYTHEADTREELEKLVQKYVTPLYEVALSELKSKSELVYWEKS